MAWTDSLIKLRNFEIEELRKRLGLILEHRKQLQQKLTALDAEADRETAAAKASAEAGWYLIGFRQGWTQRRAVVEAELRGLDAEEQGARDAISEAFEGLKKVEKTAEAMAAVKAKDLAHRESQMLDEQALRRRTAS
jgi:flagellar FliJ protein